MKACIHRIDIERCYDWISGDVLLVPRVMVRCTETADKLRVAITFGRTRKMICQSARRTNGFRVTVYVYWIVFGSLLELHGQNRKTKYDCSSNI